MIGYKESKIIIKKVCEVCNEDIEHTRCHECKIPLLLIEFYCLCYGDNEGSSHICKECKEARDKDCCTICKTKNFTSYGVDDGNDGTIIVFECRDCKSYNYSTMWTRKKRKYQVK